MRPITHSIVEQPFPTLKDGRVHHQFRDLTGKTFGRLTVLHYCGSRKDGKSSASIWACLCECGKTVPVIGYCVSRGETRSCGCLQVDMVKAAAVTHGEGSVKARSPEYVTWSCMKTRCYNENADQFPLYGGRGIKVCERWLNSFESFLEDMGRRPSKAHTIDRKNSDGDYEPGNCRWATPTQQANNRRPQNINRDRDGQGRFLPGQGA